MTRIEKVLDTVLGGHAGANIPFGDVVRLLDALGFESRIKGDHHIFTFPGIDEILNLQPRASLAKAYRVRQVRNVIVKYRLRFRDFPQV
ncbi:type II toxin-antitoxin system HicA family toxin [bacterium]|nr:MAG: type II toxin-antitoxin system HicA family toxin [bacterium]